MKKIIFYSASIIISLFWLITEYKTYNPISLKGPEFLKFYLSLTMGFYISILCLKIFGENLSKISFYFMLAIFILGVIKLFRGIILERPVGILFSILVMEIIIIMVFMSTELNQKMKK